MSQMQGKLRYDYLLNPGNRLNEITPKGRFPVFYDRMQAKISDLFLEAGKGGGVWGGHKSVKGRGAKKESHGGPTGHSREKKKK